MRQEVRLDEEHADRELGPIDGLQNFQLGPFHVQGEEINVTEVVLAEDG